MSEDTADIEALRLEVESLRRQVSSERIVRNRRVRSAFTWFFTVLAVIATVLSLLAIWTFRTFTDSDLFVERVGSVIEQPEVADAIGQAAAAQLVEALDLEDRLQASLPGNVALVAGPLTAAAQDYLAKGATALVGTEQFQRAWETALRQGHELSIGILSGSDTRAIDNSDGVIVLNLTPVVNALLARGAGFVSDVLGREVSAPVVTDDTVGAAVAALEDRLGVDLPADFGQVVLFESDDLAAAQAAYRTVRISVLLAPVAAALLIALALAVSPRRSRTALSVVVGSALLLLVAALAFQPLRDGVLSRVSDESFRGAVAATLETVLSSLRTGILVVTVLGVLAAAVLFLAGGSRMAQVSRAGLRQAPSFAATRRAPFLVGGAVLAVILLGLIPGRSWGQFLGGVLMYAGYALVVLLAPAVQDAGEDQDDEEGAFRAV